MDQGWVKLHRKIAEDVLWRCSTPEQKVILITLLIMANHKEREWEWRGEKYFCKPGEFITSAASITEVAGSGISRQNVRTALKKFKKYGFLTMESTKVNTKISIANWGKYQSQTSEGNQVVNQQLTNSQPTANQQLTTNKNERMKEWKNGKNTTTKNEALNPKEIVSLWNRVSEKPIHALNKNTVRYTMLNARVKEYGVDKVLEAINSIEKSSYLNGGGRNGWIATFDWFVKPNNFLKVLEGNYEDRTKTKDKELEDYFKEVGDDESGGWKTDNIPF